MVRNVFYYIECINDDECCVIVSHDEGSHEASPYTTHEEAQKTLKRLNNEKVKNTKEERRGRLYNKLMK